jgi:hypothetical protein
MADCADFSKNVTNAACLNSNGMKYVGKTLTDIILPYCSEGMLHSAPMDVGDCCISLFNAHAAAFLNLSTNSKG